MKYNVDDIIPFEQIQEATDYVNTVEGNYYLEDYKEDEQGRMMLIVRQMPAPSLEEVRQAKWEQIKAVRNKAEQSGCPYMGSVLDSDSLSVQRINTAVQAAQVIGEAFVVDWTMQDNTVVHMTYADVLGMPTALAVFSNELHMKARELREQINAAESIEEVNAINWQ